jgi:CheY-like chemotaxis protein
VLMDIQMSDIDGLEAARRILAEADDDHPVAILMLTTIRPQRVGLRRAACRRQRVPAQGCPPGAASPPCESSLPATR